MEYLGLKLHFSGEHDWQIGRVPLPSWTVDAFLNRNDIQAFAAFVDFVPSPQERIERLISTFIKNPSAHVSTAHHMPDDIAAFHIARMRVISSLNYNMQSDLDTLWEYCYNNGIRLIDLLCIGGDKHTPSIVSNVNAIGLNLETLCLLDRIFRYTRFDTVSPLWNRNRVMICQYSKLIKYDVKRLKPLVDKILSIQ